MRFKLINGIFFEVSSKQRNRSFSTTKIITCDFRTQAQTKNKAKYPHSRGSPITVNNGQWKLIKCIIRFSLLRLYKYNDGQIASVRNHIISYIIFYFILNIFYSSNIS